MTLAAVYHPTKGVLVVQEGKEAEFFGAMSPNVKAQMIDLAASAIVGMLVIDELGGVLTPIEPTNDAEQIQQLRRGIELAGGNADEAIEAAKKRIRDRNRR